MNYKVGDKVFVLPIAETTIGYRGPILSSVTIKSIEDNVVLEFVETLYKCLIFHTIPVKPLLLELF